MRLPSAPDSPNFEETGPIRIATGARQPSYPDRARIDSDVRYLLRPPSTPWITFDKEQQDEILTSSRSSVIDTPGLFPDAAAAIAAANADPGVPAVEPSNVVVATDILQSPADEHPHDVTHDEPLAPVSTPKRIGIAVGGTLGLSALILVLVFAFGGKKDAAPVASAARAAATPAVTEPAPPNLDVAPMPAPPSTASEAKSEKTGFAKLTIKGAAKGHRVYLDGKLLLGQGQRTFMIRCGDHTIAVGNKTDAKDVDVPCNGEYVVSK